MDPDKLLHLQILKKSYHVIIKSLLIRLELFEKSADSNEQLKEILNNKISKYNSQIIEIDKKLENILDSKEIL